MRWPVVLRHFKSIHTIALECAPGVLTVVGEVTVGVFTGGMAGSLERENATCSSARCSCREGTDWDEGDLTARWTSLNVRDNLEIQSLLWVTGGNKGSNSSPPSAASVTLPQDPRKDLPRQRIYFGTVSRGIHVATSLREIGMYHQSVQQCHDRQVPDTKRCERSRCITSNNAM